jgi:hypothetical protein
MKSWSWAVLIAVVSVVSSTQATPPEEVAKGIDQHLQDELFTPANAKVAPRTDDETFLRRVSLDIVGRQPSPDEVTKFALDSDPAKRTKLIESLLASERYGENWSRYWRDVIMYRRTEARALIASQPLQDYLKEKLNANAPWDQVATSFITALGKVQENGNAALIVAQEGKPEETVAEISRIFLGINIQCAQCHDHPTDRWKREQFHELAAFFPRVASRPEMGDQRTIVVTATDGGMGMGRGNPMFRFRGTPEHYMSDLKNPQARGKLMQPVFFLTGQSLPTGTKDADRRESLAKWITAKDNEYFAKALVNRLWSELVGEGFYEPIDDIGPDRTAQAPYTLEYLAKEFIAADYDVKWLFRAIVSTDAYQRQSRPRREANETPFTANVPQRLRADQLYDNLLATLNFADQSGRGMFGGGGGGRPFGGARFQFAAVFGFDPSTPHDEVQGSIPQALALMNGNLVSGSLRSSPNTWLGRMLSKTPRDEDAIAELYLQALSREPSVSELETCRIYLKESNSRGEGYEDLLWSLVNSSEFLHRK